MERIYHTWDKWECYPSGLYDEKSCGNLPKNSEEKMYADFLSNSDLFADYADIIITEWKHSCEHNLTNEGMNRIAWIGQASACYALGLPNKFRTGFNLLSEEQQFTANNIALDAINKWMEANGNETINMEGVASKTVANQY